MVEFTSTESAAAGYTWACSDTPSSQQWHYSSDFKPDIRLDSENSSSQCKFTQSRSDWWLPVIRQSQPKVAIPPSRFFIVSNSWTSPQSKLVGAWWVRTCLPRRWTSTNLLLPFHARILHRIRSVSTHDYEIEFPGAQTWFFGHSEFE